MFRLSCLLSIVFVAPVWAEDSAEIKDLKLRVANLEQRLLAAEVWGAKMGGYRPPVAPIADKVEFKPSKVKSPAECCAELLRLNNESRAKAGAPQLVYSEPDAKWAKAWSEEQARAGGVCQHSWEVLHRVEIYWTENVASKPKRSDGVQDDYGEAEVYGDWMKSAGHRAALLDPQWTKVGFGKAQGKDGVYWTAILSKPKAMPAKIQAAECPNCQPTGTRR